jgi:phosphatidylserine/phosphatidylglycerophosphate/cardiolipin synthase-like enzyme
MTNSKEVISKAGAWCNGEVAYLAWHVEAKVPDCLGFMITRVHETGEDAGKRRILPTWVAFEDQSNPNWNEQDSSVWPIQRYEWRDLTLRKSRDTTHVRPINFKVHYEIVPVGLAGTGRIPIPASATAPATDSSGKPSYDGVKHPLFQIGKPIKTPTISVTHEFGTDAARIAATFTNGILSTQNLVRQLQSVNKGPPKKMLDAAQSSDKDTRIAAKKNVEDHLLATLKREIVNPKSPIRSFLTGDVYDFVVSLLRRAEQEGGEVYLALYELHDKPLIDALCAALRKGLVHIILSTAGDKDPNPKGTPKDKRQPVVWDVENDPARGTLHALAKGALKDRVVDRMFNSTARIGHNKFAVLVKGDKAVSVMTGSTNWTETGLCTQSNNVIIVDDEKLAGGYYEFWQRLRDDPQPERVPLTVNGADGEPIVGAAPSSGKQGTKIRTANAVSPKEFALAKPSLARVWCSPNTKEAAVPKTNPKRPPDLDTVYQLMDNAKSAILFLTFLPGYFGQNNIIGEAAALAEKRPELFVLGAVSDPKALPPSADESGVPDTYTDPHGKVHKMPPPAIWWPHGEQSRIAMIRAAALKIPFGNLRPELLTAGHAIIHDKIIVIDPLDSAGCAVITGSHNLGYKASYCNDENMLIVRKNSALAIAYAVHVLDLYDHYVFRARVEQDIRQKLINGTIHSYEEAAEQSKPRGLLKTTDMWQDKLLKKHPKSSLEYFLSV